SIRFRLVVWYAGLLVVVVMFLGLLMHAGLKYYLEQSLSRAQLRRAQQIAETLVVNIGSTGEAHVINEINAWFAPETNDRFIRIPRGDASVLYLSSSPKDLSFDADQVPAFRGETKASSWRKEMSAGNRGLLIATVPCRLSDGRHFLVEVGASLEPIQ